MDDRSACLEAGVSWEPIPGSSIGKYQIIRRLERGGMGTVFLAMDASIHRKVALKILDPRLVHDTSIVQRFVNEARAANIIEHPGVVQISEYGMVPGGTAYLAMEYLKGESLQARLHHLGRLDLRQALRICRQITSALCAAHERGIIHRDLKPGNVMLVPDEDDPARERVKILDFGIAKLLAQAHGAPPSAEMDGTGPMLLGTPPYMAPEQCRGAGSVDHKADVYSLGVMLYYMLAGRLPFVGPIAVVLAQHLQEQPRPIGELREGLPPWLIRLLHAMLAKDPQARPSMREIRQALDRSATAGSLEVSSPLPPRRGQRLLAYLATLLTLVLPPSGPPAARNRPRQAQPAPAPIVEPAITTAPPPVAPVMTPAPPPAPEIAPAPPPASAPQRPEPTATGTAGPKGKARGKLARARSGARTGAPPPQVPQIQENPTPQVKHEIPYRD